LLVLFVPHILEVIRAFVPDFEIREHSDNDYLLVKVSVFTKKGRYQYSSLIVELAFLGARNEAPHEGSMLGMNLGKMQCFGFHLIPLLGRIGNEAFPVSGDNESVGVMAL
jgi:hypothetical protein